MVNIAITSLAGRGRLRAFLLTEVSPDAVRFLLTLSLLPLKGLVALVVWEFLRVCGQASFCFYRVTHKQPGLYMSAPGQTSDCGLMSWCVSPLHKAFFSCSTLVTPSLSVVLHNFLCVPGSKTHVSPTHHQVTTNSRVCAHLNPLLYLATCWVFYYCSQSWFLMAQMGKLRHALPTFAQGKVYTTVVLCSPPISSISEKIQTQAHKLANGEKHLLHQR